MRLHADWSGASFDREPAAAAVGPFPRKHFLASWWAHRGGGDLLLAEADGVLLPLRAEGGRVVIVGEEDLTDYHSPLGDAGRLRSFAAALAGALPEGHRFRFDSIPGEVAAPLAAGLSDGGVACAAEQHEAAAVLDLPAGHDDWLAGLRGKDRHEIRRKGRRFTEMVGEPELVEGPDWFDTFLEMHRSSAGRKGGFMDDAMEAFFRSLLEVEGAVVSVLTGAGRPAATAFGFVDDEAYYLYNSGYDPALAAASPGVVLVERLVAATISAGRRRFDFLKGDEPYKFRMGARQRPLLALEGAT
jgi:CelD/BcsL family acetyltransferase involved in cellulose biosynthesis